MTKPDLRELAGLRPHTLLNHIPAPALDSAEVLACAETIRELDGHLLPLVIDEGGHLLTDDSRLRWMAARRLSLPEVPVIISRAGDAPTAQALFHRAHYTKSALAFLAVKFMPQTFAVCREHRLKTLQNGGKSIVHSVDYAPAKTWEELAERFGVSRSLLFSAQQVEAEFEKDKRKYEFPIFGGERDGEILHQTLREHFEPKILRHQQGDEHEGNRPIGLGGVMKAIGSIRSTKGAPKRTDSQMVLFTGGLETLSKRFIYYNELDAEQRKAVDPALDTFFDAMAAAGLLELAQDKIKERLKARRVH